MPVPSPHYFPEWSFQKCLLTAPRILEFFSADDHVDKAGRF